jgi:hypothetical protein
LLRSTGAGQLDDVRWATIDQIKLVFSEPVIAQVGDLELRGVNVPDYIAAVGISAYQYDPATRTGTWTLNAPISADKLLVEFDHGAITDQGGAPLDGEWTNGASLYSGDGRSGGQFQFRFDVVPGDVDASGQVTQADFRANFARQFKGLGQAGYAVEHDLDGNGAINVRDWALVHGQMGATLPAGDPPASGGSPAAVSAGAAAPEALAHPILQRESLPQGRGPQVALATNRNRSQPAVAASVDRAIEELSLTPLRKTVLRASRQLARPTKLELPWTENDIWRRLD